jgi:hypothetical protein
MIKYDIENNFKQFLIFKKSKYCPNEEFFHLYQTTPHTLDGVVWDKFLNHQFNLSNKYLQKMLQLRYTVFDSKTYLLLINLKKIVSHNHPLLLYVS